MKRFRVERENQSFTEGYEVMIVTVHNPPYEDEDVLSHTKWKLKDCIITDVTSEKYVVLSKSNCAGFA